jgi:hypothetical protein
MRAIILSSLFFLLPFYANAAVTFSEVAWMGSVASANHEWIELYNEGAAVEVTGWTITDGMNLNIELTGVVPANAYVVLERTSDDTVAGTAFLIYTGALVNTGATLQLLRGDGAIEDQVSGGEDWQNSGGDNVTKETAQYTSGGWVTAAATPGRAITATEVAVAAASTTVSQVVTTTHHTTTGGSLQKAKPSEPVVLTLPGVTLRLTPTAQKLGYVHQPIKFSVEPSGVGDTLIDSLQYEWNFGDGEVAKMKEVTHVYEYPGTYIVTVYAGFKRQEQVARHEITILPVMLSLTTNTNGDPQVNNDSPYEIDLSGYQLDGTKSFVFPPRTILLPNQTITIAKQKVGKTRGAVSLSDTEEAVVAVLGTPQDQSNGIALVEDHSPVPKISALSYVPAVPEATEIAELTLAMNAKAATSTEKQETEVQEEQIASPQLANVGAAPLPASTRWPYVALAVTILLATFGVYAAPRGNEKE